jgi:hypothetical protein
MGSVISEFLEDLFGYVVLPAIVAFGAFSIPFYARAKDLRIAYELGRRNARKE